ncbi:MAG: helix-turn-helix transcriptional regulator [Eubacteriales bacterium]|nr:helix-turn-helix transcriptional regulator [Eubacteriales bacterium]MDD3881813.1 helix-turn-helix transcriptional regulator [Eubacteriales bacterium]MDD4513690.1 helix-turn-helix transcriptional regulator [Eubacteriales bacterium]
MNSIGERIAVLRKQKEMTQEELAGIIGVSAQSVSKWENNTTMPDIMLLPVIAHTFGVSIDALFGENMSANHSISADDAFHSACDNLKKTIVVAGNHGHTTKKPFTTQLDEYEQALSSEERMRSVIMRGHGIVYYREKTGGLLLKRPKDGWQSLLTDENAAKTIALLGNHDFIKALYTVTKTGMNTFTISSLCRACGVEDSKSLETAIVECGLFAKKSITVDDKDITVYELIAAHRLFVIFAVLRYAKEFAEYDDICYYYYGEPSFYQQ